MAGAAAENPDIRGYMYNNVGRGILFISLLFLFTAMLTFANEAAGCNPSGDTCASDDDDDAIFLNATAAAHFDSSIIDDDDDCGRVWGLRPAAFVAQVLVLGALVSAVLMPVAGSIVDHSPYRRELGMWSLAVCWVCSFAQIAINRHTWMVFLLLQGSVAVAAYLVNVVCAMAYMAELTSDFGDEMIRINGKARVMEMVSMLAYMIVIATLDAFFFGVKDTARVAQFVSCMVGGPLAMYSWQLLTPRAASHKLPEGASILTAGFVKVGETARLLRRDFPSLFTFLVAFALSEAGTGAIVGLVVIYVSQQLCLPVGPVLLLAIVATVPGALLSKRLARGGRAKEALCGILVVFIAAILGVALFCYSPKHANIVPVFAIILGIALGFVYPAQRNVVAMLIPGGLEGRVMGVYQFCSSSFTWVPSLLFSAIYEATGSMRPGLACVAIFHGSSLFILVTRLDMNAGLREVQATLKLRRHSTNFDGKARVAPEAPEGAPPPGGGEAPLIEGGGPTPLNVSL